MKLHLPLGLLSALLLSFSSLNTTANAAAMMVKTTYNLAWGSITDFTLSPQLTNGTWSITFDANGSNFMFASSNTGDGWFNYGYTTGHFHMEYGAGYLMFSGNGDDYTYTSKSVRGTYEIRCTGNVLTLYKVSSSGARTKVATTTGFTSALTHLYWNNAGSLSNFFTMTAQEVNQLNVYTWVGSSSTFGAKEEDVMGGFGSNSTALSDATLFGYYGSADAMREAFGTAKTNGSFNALNFVYGEQDIGLSEADFRENKEASISVGAGRALTTSAELGSDFYLGDLTIAEDASGYSLSSGSANSHLVLGSSRASEANTVTIKAGESFSLGTAGKVWSEVEFAAGVTNLNIEVAAGKKFSFYGNLNNSPTLTISLSGDGDIVLSEGMALRGAQKSGYTYGITKSGKGVFDMGGAHVSGDMHLIGGSLANAQNFDGTLVVHRNDATDLNLGGLRADLINFIYQDTNAASVKNIGTGTLTFAEAGSSLCVGSKHLSGTYLLDFVNGGAGSSIHFGDGISVTLTLDAAAEKALATFQGKKTLSFSNAAIDVPPEALASYAELQKWFAEHFSWGAGVQVSFDLDSVENGKLNFLVSADGIWYASAHGTVITQTDRVNDWDKLVVDTSFDINVTPIDGYQTTALHYLDSKGIGNSSGHVTIRRDQNSAEQYFVWFDNSAYYTGLKGTGAYVDTTFSKDIIVEDDAALTVLQKVGKGKLTVNGNIQSSGDVEVVAGEIVLNGKDNVLRNIKLDRASATNDPDLRDRSLERADLNAIWSEGDESKLTVNGRLTLTDENGTDLSASTGILGGDGEIVMQNNRLTISGNVLDADNHLVINLDGKKAALVTQGETRLGGLAGEDGTVTLGDNVLIAGSVNGAQNVFEGDLGGNGNITFSGEKTNQVLISSGYKGGDVSVEKGAALTLIGANNGDKVLQAQYSNITVGEGSTLKFSAPAGGAKDAVSSSITATNVVFESGSYTEFDYNFIGAENGLQTDTGNTPMLKADGITIQEGAQFALNNLGSMFDVAHPEALKDFVIMQGNNVNFSGITKDDIGSMFTMKGAFLVYYKNVVVSFDEASKAVVVNADVQSDNVFNSSAGTANSQTGANLLWAARYSAAALDASPTNTFYQIMSAIATNLATDPAGTERAMAAIAGSSIPALGTAQRDAFRSQINRMRDHAGLMGLDPTYAYDDLPFYHPWVQAESSMIELHNNGDESGYKYTTWGGSVGMDVDLDEMTSIGFGLTAQYGKFSADPADSASGHIDNYYLSFIGRFQSGKNWGHTVIAMVGLNQVDINRSVRYQNVSYSTSGSTNGWGIGAMYEVTYDIVLNAEKSRILQPLFNFSVMKTTLKGYSESGPSGLGLDVGKQKWTNATVAAGLRWIGTVGTNVFARAAQLELRASVAHDLGDTRGEATVALQANPDSMGKVRAAEVGSTALQLGAGLRVPVGEQTLIYANTNGDFRSGMVSWDITAGVRYDF